MYSTSEVVQFYARNHQVGLNGCGRILVFMNLVTSHRQYYRLCDSYCIPSRPVLINIFKCFMLLQLYILIQILGNYVPVYLLSMLYVCL